MSEKEFILLFVVILVASIASFYIAFRLMKAIWHRILRVKEHSEKFEKVSSKLAEVDSKFAEVDSKFAEVDSKLAQVDSKLATFLKDSSFESTSGRLTRIAFTRIPYELGANDTYERLDHNYGSFNTTADRKQVSCRDILKKSTAVILIAGQSNAANHGNGKLISPANVYNFNFFDGNLYEAREPLLGNTGMGTGFPARLGKLLVERGLYENVILVPIAVGGTYIKEWVPGGRFSRRFNVAIERLRMVGLKPTHMLWHQGEAESSSSNADFDEYVEDFEKIFMLLRRFGMFAPIYIAQVSVCNNEPNEVIRGAQRSLVDPLRDIRAGPDSDQIFGPYMRHDGCHMSEAGLDRHAELWLEVLVRDMPR